MLKSKFYGLLVITLLLSHCICILKAEDKIFFDDFSYTKTNVASGADSAFGSIFGYNDWIYSDGIRKMKSWYRWNIGEPKFDSLSAFDLSGEGFDLKLKAGVRKTGLLPMMHSTFIFRHGTYASRVYYPSHHDNDNTIFAYWLISPISFIFHKGDDRIQYTSEMDFEWNNWFHKNNEECMQIGCNNHNYKNPFSTPLTLSSFLNGRKLPVDGFNYKVGNQDIFYNQWYICVFIVDTISQTTKIYMKSDYDSLPGITTFGGMEINSASEIKPFVINNYSPDYDLLLVYSVHMISNQFCHDNGFGADWLLYSPEVNLSFDDIKSKVRELKAKGIMRLNGLDAPTYIHDESSKLIDCFFSGPDSVRHGVDAEWKLDTKYLRWTAYLVDMSYRTYDSTNGWSSPMDHYSNRFHFNSGCLFDSLELTANLKDGYRDFSKQISKKIHFTYNPQCTDQANDDFEMQVYPNPAKYFLYIKQSDTVWHTIQNIKIFSALGIKFYESGYKSVIDVSFLAPGIYFLKVDNHYVKFIKL